MPLNRDEEQLRRKIDQEKKQAFSITAMTDGVCLELQKEMCGGRN
jgi:hypothetical protein